MYSPNGIKQSLAMMLQREPHKKSPAELAAEHDLKFRQEREQIRNHPFTKLRREAEKVPLDHLKGYLKGYEDTRNFLGELFFGPPEKVMAYREVLEERRKYHKDL